MNGFFIGLFWFTVAAAPRLTDAAWLAGPWFSDRAGAVSEEVWTLPRGGTMVGMFRLVEQGQFRLAEIMTLTEETGASSALVLRIRHYDQELTPLLGEDLSGPAVFVAMTANQTGLVFHQRLANADGSVTIDPTRRMEFTRRGDEGMTITLIKPDASGQSKKTVFSFQRDDGP